MNYKIEQCRNAKNETVYKVYTKGILWGWNIVTAYYYEYEEDRIFENIIEVNKWIAEHVERNKNQKLETVNTTYSSGPIKNET